ncbi:hypothetical protein SteCoe_6244 [Stentor coeruleus]|uniref:LNR domain-containing protein n=1 Tax=Stentor coeruleus TaxID=5963 RepID=A0A1R2CQJ7_9CILI|nr:hypothetical protein SteCoe_6244 [Stentor coeruleus]
MSVLQAILLISIVLSRKLFTCEESKCNLSWINDGACDDACMTPICNYDSLNSEATSPLSPLIDSDCFFDCLNTGCDYYSLGNGICDKSCNSYACGWDFGDCGFCANGCTEEMLTNDMQDEKCRIKNCRYDNNAYGWCAEGCYYDDLLDSECKSECDKRSCLWDNWMCEVSICSPGCASIWIRDGYCDGSVCNVPECDYDGEDCSCSYGCNLGVMEEDYCRDNDPCANFECSYKNFLCGDCNAGCYYDMIGNKNCDESCNNSECSFDFGDCGCNYGCYTNYDKVTQEFTYSGECDNDCFAPDCNYNIKVCAEKTDIKMALLYQLITLDWKSIYNQESCTCDHDIKLYDTGDLNPCEIYSSCFSPECLYCFGKVNKDIGGCLLNDGIYCLVCDSWMVMDQCYPSISKCPFGFSENHEISSLFSETLHWCMKDPYKYSRFDYKIYYVDPDFENEDGSYGDGSETNPMSSLYYAFISVYASFTKIILKPTDYYYDYDESITSPFVDDLENPLFSNVPNKLIELWIIGDDEGVGKRPIIYWLGYMKISTYASLVVIKNIEFRGTKILQDCELDHCLYCPYIKEVSPYYLSDRTGPVDADVYINEYGKNCNSYSDQVLFEFMGTASIIDVNFIGFRHQFMYFIKTTGNLTLENVNFSNMQPKFEGSIIYLTCTVNCLTVSMGYKNGEVSKIGNGYEVTEHALIGSFFKGNGYHSLTLENVQFLYNFMYSSLQSAYSSSLIYSINHLGAITIKNCDFYYNYVNNLILIDVTDLGYSDLEIVDGISLVYSRTHFTLESTTFNKIYCSSIFISYFMNRIRHNINLTNVEINDVIVGNHGVIEIDNLGELESSDKEWQTILKTIDDKRVEILISPRSVRITNLTMHNLITGDIVIIVKNMPSIFVDGMSITNTTNGDRESIYKIIEGFNEMGFYMSRTPPVAETPQNLDCMQVTYFYSNYQVNMKNIEIYNTRCSMFSGSVGIYIDTVEANVTLESISIYDISDTSLYAMGLYLAKTQLAHLINVYFYNITNIENSVAELYKVNNISITNFTADLLRSAYAGSIKLTEVEILSINNFTISNSLSDYLNAGCLGIESSGQGLNATMDTINLINCDASQGLGGGMYWDSLSTTKENIMKVSNLYVSGSIAREGAAVFITSRFKLDSEGNSIIENIYIESCTSIIGGIIGDFHHHGVLTIRNLFITNCTGLNSAIRGYYYIEGGFLMDIYNATITSSVSYEGAFSFNSMAIGNSASLHNIVANNIDGPIIYSVYMLVYGNNIEIYGAVSAFVLQTMSENYFENVTISFVRERVVYINEKSYFECKYCEIHNCNGTILVASEGGGFGVYNSNIYDNHVDTTSIAYISGESLKLNVIDSTNIINNGADEYGFIRLEATWLLINNCYFNWNYMYVEDDNGIYCSSSTLTINNSTFYESMSNKNGGVLNAYSQSNIEMNNVFINWAVTDSGLIYATESKLTLRKIECYNIWAYVTGSCIFTESSDLVVEDSIFTNDSATWANAIYMSKGNLRIQNSVFYNCNNWATWLTATVQVYELDLLEILDSYFGDTYYNVNALITFDVKKCFITGTTFANHNSIEDGAVSMHKEKNNGEINIKNCKFLNNFNEGNGGGLSVYDNSLVIEDSIFAYNKAEKDGGAIYYESPKCNECTFKIIGNTEIYNNSCKSEGGGIKWLNSRPQINETVKIYNNSAYYGGDIASKPAKLGFGNRRMLITTIASLEQVAPGQTYNGKIIIYLLDTYGNVVKSDNTSDISIKGQSYPVTNGGSLHSISGDTMFKSIDGVYTITNFVPLGPPNSNMTMTITASGIDTSSVLGDDSYDSEASIFINLRDCIDGEQKSSSACTECPKDKYTLEADTYCKDCPVGATCYGGDSIVPNSGYWRPGSKSEMVYKCSISEACPGGNETIEISTCSSGYTGILCQSCEAGYSRDSSGKCSKCPSEDKNAIILLFLIICIFIIAAIFVQTTLRTAFSPKAITSIYIKIFTNYLQLVFLTTQFKLEWPSYVLEIFNVQKSASSVSEQIFSVDCYLSKDENSGSSTDAYYTKLVFLALLPFIILIVSFIFWMGICFVKDTWCYLRREMLTTVVVLFFIVYPTIVQNMFLHFSCIKIDTKGTYLEQNTIVECWDAKHLKFTFIVALPGAFIWAFTIPTLVMLYLTKNRRRLFDDKIKVIYGFIFQGYKQSCYYWEFVIMYRKIILIAISVFLSQISVLVQALTVMVILLSFFFLQYIYRPYNTGHLNHMETEALFTATITIYCGLYYLSEQINEEFKMFLFIVILVGNAYFLIYWLKYMISAVIDLFLKYFPRYKEIFKHGDPYDEDFNTSKIIQEGVYINDQDGGIKAYTFFDRQKKDRCDPIIARNISDIYKLVTMEELGVVNNRA